MTIGNSGYFIATEVCQMLESRPNALIECLTALKYAEDGQKHLQAGDPSGALTYLKKAHEKFEGIREAKLLLGINKADIAAAYGNLGNYRRAADYAEDCISIVKGNARLAFTEAMARMTLARHNGSRQ